MFKQNTIFYIIIKLTIFKVSLEPHRSMQKNSHYMKITLKYVLFAQYVIIHYDFIFNYSNKYSRQNHTFQYVYSILYILPIQSSCGLVIMVSHFMDAISMHE